MKRNIMIILIILALAVALGVYLAMNSTIKKNISTPAPPTVSGSNIEIKSFAFNPPELKIKKGETVTWTNLDSAKHTVTSDSGNELNSELLSKAQTYSHTFNTAGIFEYHCTPHPYMKAKIIVE